MSLKAFLTKQSGNPIFESDDRRALANGYDALLAGASNVLAAHGIDRTALMRLYINHAFEVMANAPGMTPADTQNVVQLVIQEAMRLHSDFDDPDRAM